MSRQASCTKCQKVVTYTTKRPKFCGDCRKLQPKVYRKPRASIPVRSKSEMLMQKLLGQILPDAESIDGGYYSWLQSPKGAPMQLDRYYPELKLAFEYNGAQHYEFNAYMHKTKEAFAYLQACDKLKAKLVAKRGATLISIKYDKTLTKGYLVRRLKEAGLLPGLKTVTKVDDIYLN